MHTISQSPPIKKKGVNKLVLGFAAVVATAIVGTTGFAAATSQNNADKPTKEQLKQCLDAGFKNYGQCVREWAQNKNKPGGGYGNIDIDIDLDIKGNHNVVQIIINFWKKM